MLNLPPTDNLIRYHIWVSGKVQGVGYRYSLLQAAHRLHLKGWVRNLPDGRVEAVLEGNSRDTEQMLRCCRQENPIAVVAEIEIKAEMPESLQSFEICS